MKYNKKEINELANAYIKEDCRRSYDKLGGFIYGISEEVAKKMMKRYNLGDEFILEEMRSKAYLHVCEVFKIKFNPDHEKSCAASYIIGMLNSRMIDYLRSLSRADKYGELNKMYVKGSDGKRRLVQVKRDDVVSADISTGLIIPQDIDVNELDFDNSYIFNRNGK